jgi:hypothetical protein
MSPGAGRRVGSVTPRCRLAGCAVDTTVGSDYVITGCGLLAERLLDYTKPP